MRVRVRVTRARIRYSLSDVELVNAGLYASLKFDVAPLLELAFESADSLLDDRGNQTESGGGGGMTESDGGEGGEFDPTRLVLDVRRLLKPILAGPLPTLPLDVYVAVGELAYLE